MYLEHFGLGQPPFRITPNQDFFYSGANRGAILDALVYAIVSGEGILKLAGEVGTGKTMLCRALESRLPGNIDIIYLPNPSLPPEEILHAIAGELGLNQPAGQKSTQIIREMQNHLIDKHVQGRQVVVFIDEAQSMPLDSLEQIRLLSNLETGSSKLLQIVLFGQPELDQHIDLPQIRQLKERITHSFCLHPLNKKEIADYLMCRMRVAGYRGPHVFSQAAIRLMHKASQGLIRRVNILADKALLAAFSNNTHAVTVKQVKAAIRDSSYHPQPAFSPARLMLALLLSAGVLFIAVWVSMEWPALAAQYFGGDKPEPQPATLAQPAPPPPAPLEAGPPAATHAEYAPRHEALEKGPALADAPLDGRPAQAAPPSVESTPRDEQDDASLKSRLDASRAWLKSQNDTGFAIQLMAVPPEAVEAELARIQAQRLGAEQLIVYNNVISNKTAISIAIGAFPSAVEARAALANLPASYAQHRPLLRTIKSIRAKMEKKQKSQGSAD